MVRIFDYFLGAIPNMSIGNQRPHSSVQTDLTIIISASPSPTHPSIELIQTVLESTKKHLSPAIKRVVFCLDAPKASLPVLETQRYEDFIDNLRSAYVANESCRFSIQSEWGHLSGGLKKAIPLIETRFVLVIQHDLPFIERIELEPLMEILESYSEVKRIEFTRDSGPCLWDIDPRYRRKRYKSSNFHVGGKHIPLTKTLAWTDNNYLCSKSYLEKIVFGVIKNERIFPEHAMNLASSRLTSNLFGNWRFGSENSGPYILHTDGKGIQDAKLVNSSVYKVFLINRQRLKVAVERFKFRKRGVGLIFRESWTKRQTTKIKNLDKHVR